MLPFSALSSRRLATVVAFGVGTALASAAAAQAPASGATATSGSATVSVAAPPAAPTAAETAAMKKLLEQKFQGAAIGGIARSPIAGLYEVRLDDQIIYSDAKVTYVIVGNIYEAATKKNLTEARLRELNRVAFDSLPLDLSFKRVKGTGQRKLAIFSDADCPYCAKLEEELKSIDNVTIYTFLFPIDQLHPDAARKSRVIWCAPDRVKAWDEFFAKGTLPTNNGECENPVLATRTLGAKLKVVATPTLVFADGSVVPGALPAARLESEIKEREAEAARLAAAKK